MAILKENGFMLLEKPLLGGPERPWLWVHFALTAVPYLLASAVPLRRAAPGRRGG